MQSTGVAIKKVKLSNYGYSILQIETMGACNMKCSFCPYPLRVDNESILDSRKIYDLVDTIDVRDKDFKFVQFSQFNEPLMDSRIFEFYRYCYNKKIKARCITNGLLLNSKSIRENFISANPDAVKISLQTISKEHFTHQRGIEIDTDRYFNILFKYLSDIKNHSYTSVTLDLACNFLNPFKKTIKKIAGISSEEPSIEDVPKRLSKDLQHFLRKLKDFDSSFNVDSNQINDFLNQSSAGYDFLNPPTIKLADNIEMAIKLFHYGRRISDWKEYKGPVSCTNPILGILADGSVAPCCLSYDPDLSLGNINKKSLPDILQDNKAWLNDLRETSPLKSKTCQKCMGAPTRRGIVYKNLISKFSKLRRYIS